MSDADRWEERYRTGDTPWDTGSPSSELQRVLAEQKLAGGSAIDLGCGTGANSVWLAQQGFEVTGVDISPLALERAQARAASVGVTCRFLQVDLLAPPADLEGPFDFVFDRGCYHVIRRFDVRPYLSLLRRIIRPKALALVLAGNAHEPHHPGPPVVSEEEIRAELGSVLTLADLHAFRFDQHPGDSVRFLGWSCLLRG